MPNELSRASLVKCEAVITRGMQTFVEVGQALQRIRDGRLYQPRYDSFERYCQQRWQMSKPHATRLITAAQVVEQVSDAIEPPNGTPAPMGTNRPNSPAPPVTERVARELTPLRDKPDEVREAWREANGHAREEGREVTSKDVREAVRGRQMGPVVPTPMEPEPGSEGIVTDIVGKWNLVGRAAKEVLAMERNAQVAHDLTDHQIYRIDEARRRASEGMDR